MLWLPTYLPRYFKAVHAAYALQQKHHCTQLLQPPGINGKFFMVVDSNAALW